MAKGTRKIKEEVSPLLAALKFVSVAQSEAGTPNAVHCRIVQGQVVSYDGILAAGCLLADPLPHMCPNTFKFIAALERARGALSITQMDNTHMLFKSDKLKAVVPCLDPAALVYIAPDPALYPLSDLFRRAGAVAGAFTREGAQQVHLASILTRNGSLVGTNGTAVIEAWHGISTPPDLIIPKMFFDVIAKVAKPIERFGFSNTSFTVWFQDQSWIKTQLYQEHWPDVDRVLAMTNNVKPINIPKDLAEAVQSVASFSPDNFIHFGDGTVRSHIDEAEGAVYVCKGIAAGPAFNAKHLLALIPHMKTVDFVTNDRAAVFFGSDDALQIRGAMSKVRPGPVNY